jgi:DNA-binding MarR family transcriptional regulator
MSPLTMAKRESSKGSGESSSSQPRGAQSPGFLLAQVGAHAAARFAERLQPLGLTPAHAGLLRMIASSSGASQQQIALALGAFPSRMVGLVDELQQRKLVERQPNPQDRRSHSLTLTAEGRRVLEGIGRVAREHQDALLAALSPSERETLSQLLLRVADEQGLARGVHPGLARMQGTAPVGRDPSRD